MIKIIKALKRKGKKSLSRKVCTAVFNDIYALPDTPEKISLLKKYLIKLKARLLIQEPIEFLIENRLIISKNLFENIQKEKYRYTLGLLRKEDYALELFWIIKNFIETIIAIYDTDRSKFPIELDLISLRTMLWEL